MLIGSLIGDPKSRNTVAAIAWILVLVLASPALAPGPKWAIGDLAAAGATSAYHRPSSAAHLPTLHQVVRRASSAAAQSVRRPVFPGAFSGRVPGTSKIMPGEATFF
jgi:hypothetical protein